MDKKAVDIAITTEYIKLDALLKFAAECQSGGEAKERIKNGDVLVNGEVCVLRGRKLYPGDSAEISGHIIRVTGK